jgi:hypothetical protein
MHEQLIGKFIFDPNGRDLRVTGFRFDGKVVLADDDNGEPFVMTKADVVALENEAEARTDGGLFHRADRVTCPLCEDWNLVAHDHFFDEDTFLDSFDDDDAEFERDVIELRSFVEVEMDRHETEALRMEIFGYCEAKRSAEALGRQDVADSYRVRINEACRRFRLLNEEAA